VPPAQEDSQVVVFIELNFEINQFLAANPSPQYPVCQSRKPDSLPGYDPP
jgi:hypothetical protein